MQNGGLVVTLSIATSESWKDERSGERRERTEWHRVVIFNEGLGKIAERYLKKGAKVYLEGKLTTRKWQDQSGADRYSTEIHLTPFNGVLTFLDSRRDGERPVRRRAGGFAGPATIPPTRSRSRAPQSARRPHRAPPFPLRQPSIGDPWKTSHAAGIGGRHCRLVRQWRAEAEHVCMECDNQGTLTHYDYRRRPIRSVVSGGVRRRPGSSERPPRRPGGGAGSGSNRACATIDESIRTAAISTTAPAPDRRHERAPVLARDATQLHSATWGALRIPRAFTRYSDGG